MNSIMGNNSPPKIEISELLKDWNENPSDDSAEALFKIVYDELRRQAHRYLQKERDGHTLQTTALVSEAYLKLVKQESVKWESGTHFLESPRRLCAGF